MSHHYVRHAAVTACMAGALWATACGSDSPSSPSPTSVVTPAPAPAPAPTPAPTPQPPAPVAVSLSGNVVSSGGSPVPGATVTILDGANGGRSTTTSSAGAYRFDALQSSNGNVSAKSTGYQESIRGLYIDGAATLNFTLSAVPVAPTFTGTWRGMATSSSCKDDGAAAGVCRVVPGLSGMLVMTLTQSGSAVMGTVDFSGYPLQASGTAQSDRLQINGTSSINGVDYEYRNWNTTMSASSMAGGFTFLLYQKQGGSVQYTMQLVNVARVSASVPAATH